MYKVNCMDDTESSTEKNVNIKQKQVCIVTHNSFNYVITTTCFDPLFGSSSGRTPKSRNVFQLQDWNKSVCLHVYVCVFLLENCE
jgi:hypothetical protein